MSFNGPLDTLFAALSTADDPHKLSAARALRALARRIESQVEESERRRKGLAQWRDLRESAPRAYQDARAEGLDHLEALERTAARLDTLPATVATYVEKERRRQARAADAALTLEVLKLARQGLTNAAIGRRLDLHPSTVGRRLKKALTAAQTGDPRPGSASGRLAAEARRDAARPKATTSPPWGDEPASQAPAE